MLCPGPINNMCSLIIFINILKVFQCDMSIFIYYTNSLTNKLFKAKIHYYSDYPVFVAKIQKHNESI